MTGINHFFPFKFLETNYRRNVKTKKYLKSDCIDTVWFFCLKIITVRTIHQAGSNFQNGKKQGVVVAKYVQDSKLTIL